MFWLAAVLLIHPAFADSLPAPDASIQITDRYGQTLRVLRSEDSTLSQPVSLDTLSPWVLLATLAAEDRRFFSHSGVDFRSAARALWQNTSRGRVVSGGSTVTQQLVRLLEPRPRTLMGKIREALKALALERRLTKRQILEAYLNEVSYGNGCKGIEAASRTYLEVPSSDLSLGQAALLAGLPKSPLNYDPVRHWDKAIYRQQTVLKRLLEWGWIDETAYRSAIAEKLHIANAAKPWIAPHFTEQIRQRLLEGGRGFVVRTTLDADLQQALQSLLAAHISELKTYHVTNGALLVLDNASGDVLAWVGSSNFFNEHDQGQVDGVTALRQPGSALKPFAYGLAFARGMRPSDIIVDEPLFDNGYMPKNYDETWHGPVRLREALACSYNVPAVRVAQQIGVGPLIQTLHAFGLTDLDRPADYYGLGMVLGNGEVPLLQLTNAYATLARGGEWIAVRYFASPTLDRDGRPPHRALGRDVCYLVTDILSDNSARARAFGLNSPFHLPFAFAAKTGTTKDYHDNWAMGYTPDWTIGVWVGNFDAKPMRGVSGITGAAPLLHDAALLVAERYGTRPFEMPRGVREIEICPDSGLLPGASCPNAMREVFLANNPPTRICDLPHSASVNRPPPGRSMNTVEIAFPVQGDIFKIDPRMPREAQALHLRSTVERPDAVAHWFVDARELPTDGLTAWWPLTPGRHRVKLQVLLPDGMTFVKTTKILVVP